MSKRKKANTRINQAAKRQKKKRTSPLWTLPEGITYSSLSTWDDCPEQFALKYIEGLTSKKLSVALEFGSIIHLMLEHQFNSTNPHEVADVVAHNYREVRVQKITNTADKDTLDLLLELAKVTFPHYCDYWSNDDKKLNWVSREEQFEVPYHVPYPDGTSREILLRGMRDGIYRGKDKLGIFETKTKSQINENQILEGLQCDMQTMFYIVATMLEINETPLEVKYNIVRRSGLTFRKSDTIPSYCQRVEEDILKRPDHYFKRFTVTLTKNDVSSFLLRSLDPTLRLFLQWWDSIKKDPSMEGRFKSQYHRLNCRNLVSKYGKVDVWDAIFKRRTGYYYREEVFPELENDSPVTWNNTQDLLLQT